MTKAGFTSHQLCERPLPWRFLPKASRSLSDNSSQRRRISQTCALFWHLLPSLNKLPLQLRELKHASRKPPRALLCCERKNWKQPPRSRWMTLCVRYPALVFFDAVAVVLQIRLLREFRCADSAQARQAGQWYWLMAYL